MSITFVGMIDLSKQVRAEVEDNPAQVMMRKVIALFDEYQSKENASTYCAR